QDAARLLRGGRRGAPDPWRRGLHEGVRDRARGPRRAARAHWRRNGRDHEGDPREDVRAVAVTGVSIALVLRVSDATIRAPLHRGKGSRFFQLDGGWLAGQPP